MKVLLFNGSPHKAGCTFTALSEVAKSLEEAGIETEILQIGSRGFRGCTGCRGCRSGNGCVFGKEDGLNDILGRCEEADGFVFGSPVYYASPNGAMLSFMDRLFYSGAKALAHKPGACVCSARRAGTTASLDVLSKYLTINQMPVVSSTYWPMVHGNTPAEVLQDKEGLQTMRNAARNLVWLVSCIQAGKQAGISAPQAERDSRTNFIR